MNEQTNFYQATFTVVYRDGQREKHTDRIHATSRDEAMKTAKEYSHFLKYGDIATAQPVMDVPTIEVQDIDTPRYEGMYQ